MSCQLEALSIEIQETPQLLGQNIHSPAIFMFTRDTGFWPVLVTPRIRNWWFRTVLPGMQDDGTYFSDLDPWGPKLWRDSIGEKSGMAGGCDHNIPQRSREDLESRLKLLHPILRESPWWSTGTQIWSAMSTGAELSQDVAKSQRALENRSTTEPGFLWVWTLKTQSLTGCWHCEAWMIWKAQAFCLFMVVPRSRKHCRVWLRYHEFWSQPNASAKSVPRSLLTYPASSLPQCIIITPVHSISKWTYLILGNWQEDETCCVLMIGSVASQNPTLAQARLLFCLEVLTAMMRTRDSVVTCSER